MFILTVVGECRAKLYTVDSAYLYSTTSNIASISDPDDNTESDVHGDMFDGPEQRLVRVFDQARKYSTKSDRPVIIFLDQLVCVTTLFKVPHNPLQSTTPPSSKYHTTLFKVPHHLLQSTTDTKRR